MLSMANGKLLLKSMDFLPVSSDSIRLKITISFFNRVEKPFDLQLPSTCSNEFCYVPAATTEIEPPPRIFNEKTVTNLTDTSISGS